MLRAVVLSLFLWNAVQCAQPNCETDVAEALQVYWEYFKCNVTETWNGYKLVIKNGPYYRVKLTKIPNVENVTILTVHSSVSTISDDAFENFNALEYVEFTNNSIKEMPAGIFANLRHVTHLSLERNEMESMAPLAKLPPNLLSLYLSHNKLRRVTGLASHPHLQNLHIANNLLTSFVVEPPIVFSSLERLDLKRNQIKEYYTPTLSNLHDLNLNGNELTRIPTDMFIGLAGLFYLDLSSNLIESIDTGAFTHAPSLTELNLANNSLKIIDANVFLARGSKVRSLRLKHNMLQFLSFKLLVRMPQLEDVSLHHNPWICGCLDDLLSWIEEFNIHIWCRAHSFNGTVPVCVVHSGEKNICPYRYFEQDTKYFMQHRSQVTSIDQNCPNIM